jgi:hypothetical protein
MKMFHHYADDGRVMTPPSELEPLLKDAFPAFSKLLGHMQDALLARKNPLTYKNNAEILEKSAHLGEVIQRFADVLEREFQSTIETR